VTARTGASHRELSDVLERVLTRGIIVEFVEDVEAGDREVNPWFRLSIAGVDVLEVAAGVSWHCLSETEE